MRIYGILGKITKKENDNWYKWKKQGNIYNSNIKIDECRKVKHSKQLTDLIEVGDVIKYKELRSITNILTTNFYENYICDVHNEEELKNIINECNNKKIKILEILTKEQFLANCYKVGGEKWD